MGSVVDGAVLVSVVLFPFKTAPFLEGITASIAAPQSPFVSITFNKISNTINGLSTEQR